MVPQRMRSLSITLVAALAAAGCGSGGGTGSSEIEGRGPITFATGEMSSFNTETIAEWNRSHPEQRVRVIELPENADDQRQQMVQNAETKSDAFTVLDLDNVWNAEFAANRWITELPEEQFDLSEYLAPTVKTAKYSGRLFSVPAYSDGALLYYRKDLLNKVGAQPPKSWAEMREVCARVLELPEAEGMSCYAGQHEKSEALTVNFAEAVHGAGGEIIGDDGRPRVDTPEAKKGLQSMVEGFRSGMIPRGAIAFEEPENKRAFGEGDLVFSRNWPFMWSELESSKVAGKVEVSPIPGISGKGVSSLGGHNLAISRYGDNKATALDFIKFYASEQNQRKRLREGSLAPTRAALYDDPKLREENPYLPELKESILNAEPRPRVFNYGEVTLAIQDEAYAALSGEKSTDQALRDMQNRLEGLTEK